MGSPASNCSPRSVPGVGGKGQNEENIRVCVYVSIQLGKGCDQSMTDRGHMHRKLVLKSCASSWKVVFSVLV